MRLGNTSCRYEYAKPSAARKQVVPVWEDGVIVGVPRQRADVAEGRISGGKLRITVGRQSDRIEGLEVQSESERERDARDHIIPVVADVRSPWHDTAAYLAYHVIRADLAGDVG